MKFKAILAILAVAASIPASADVLYSNNFETNTNGFTGAGFLTGTQGYGALGFGQQMLRNNAPGNPAAASVLNLNFGGAVSDANLSFSFGALDSWDGNNCCGPDYFNIRVDGNLLFTQNFNISNGSPAVNAHLTTLSYGNQLGFSGWADQAYTISLNLGNLAAGDHTIEFFASGNLWQAGEDESWAIDNISLAGEQAVPPADVPEPMSGALLLGGLGVMALALRRRRA
ncbi:PEP-CTERM protein-sorting domain-containing protein [Duganella sp. CF458]|uniref:PEP-CTERM sorting domain-containing protein n=1 Tax=Duganella sp. CF458 TaxID=1884368 RepID=UPI0008F1780D|nr:PEP-CTERM sorting domain-containing protein [Duganella sp. CF458]SFF78347.1 PEP-CTERM protein-sorting domain-containing protein [Duganella sp. CF458]